MTDPYKVLGVSPSAGDDEVKSAYKELAKKYHSDNYVNNPLADLAEEKMKEINVAYDTIMNERRNGRSGQSSSGYSSGYGTSSGSSQFADIRRLITQNRIVEAEELLNGIPAQNRDAEWHFLKGNIFYKRGWLDEAFRSFTTAVNMSPNNMEYRAAYSNMARQRGGAMNGYPGGYRTSDTVNGCNGCDMCTSLVCADCCCECMGGDLIPCC